MSVQLSHTAKELYLRCPLAYYIHYILGYREKVVGSPLPFGNAIDEGLNTQLKGKTLEESLKKFNELWENPKINGKILVGPKTDLIRFSKSDIKEGLADTPWECLKIKGEMLLKSYHEEIIPKIRNVLAVQVPLHITNDYGDRLIGFGDLIAEWENKKIYAFDNKTSSSAYPKDAVTEGDKAKQLALYYEELRHKFQLDGAGFIVLEKGIRKREPQTRIKVLTGQVPETIIDETFNEFEEVLHNIKMGRFPSNHPNCNTYFGNCICEKYIESNGTDTSHLVKVKKK